jgi:penicillin-binding protein 1C
MDPQALAARGVPETQGVGHPDFKPMNRLSGYLSAAELSQRIMMSLHQAELSGLQDIPFPPPPGYRPHRLCAMTGRLASQACDKVILEWMASGQEPVDICSAHVCLAIDTRSGLLANRTTPRRRVEVRTFVDLPPRYAAWAATAGLPRPPSPSIPPVVAIALRIDKRPLSSPGPAISRAPIPLTAGITPRIRVTSPENGVILLRDPDTPPDHATVALRATASPPVEQLVWYIDGQPFATVDYPHAARWPLAAGEHTIQARIPYRQMASKPIRVRVSRKIARTRSVLHREIEEAKDGHHG